MCVCVCAYVYVCLCIFMCVNAYAHGRIFVPSVCIYVCVYVCVSVNKNKELYIKKKVSPPILLKVKII